MPRRSSSSENERKRDRRRKLSRSPSSESSSTSNDRSSSRKSPKRKSRHSRSSSRSRTRHRSRSSSRSKSYRSSRRSRSRSNSRSSRNKKNKRRSKSSSPDRFRKPSSKRNSSEKELDQLQLKVQQAAKAAAIADAELREKGLLSELSSEKKPIVSLSDSIQRAQTIDEINAPSFVQHRFASSRVPGKPSPKSLEENGHMSAIFGMGNPKLAVNPGALDASVKNLETWKENPEMLVHESLFLDQIGKQERWLKKLLILRKKSVFGDI